MCYFNKAVSTGLSGYLTARRSSSSKTLTLIAEARALARVDLPELWSPTITIGGPVERVAVSIY